MASIGKLQWLTGILFLLTLSVRATEEIETKLKHIGEVPEAVLEVKQILSHGPVMTSAEEELGEDTKCPEEFVLVNEGSDSRSKERACKQCPMGYFKSTDRKCSACQDSMTSIFGATGKDQCFQPRPNIKLLTKEIKKVDKEFSKKPCGIVNFVGDMIKKCSDSQGLESPICKIVLSPFHEKLVDDYLDGDEDHWCENEYFMKNVTEEFDKNLCSSVNNLLSQLKSCDSSDKLCQDLKDIFSDMSGRFDLCKEKKFLFYVLERILVMENPCNLHKLLSSMNTKPMEKRSSLAKPIFDEINRMMSNESFEEFLKEWLDTSDFWSVDMCSETKHLKSFVFDDIWDDKCNALQNLGTYRESCDDATFKKKNKIACKISEIISESEIPENFKDAVNFDLYSIKPCKESEKALDHLKSVAKKPCAILESFKKFGKCSKSSLYCKMMDTIRAMFEDEDDEGLGAALSEWFDISITDINPCELAEFIGDLWVEIGKKPCDVFKIIEKKGSCKSKRAPCKIFKTFVSLLTDSELPSEFEKAFGVKFWRLNPCEEWERLKAFLLALIDRPCSFLSLFESQYKAQCAKNAKSVVCAGLSFAKSAIKDSSEIQSFVSNIDVCAEQDYSVGIFKKVSTGISKGSCIGYKELSGYVKECPISKPMVCSIFGTLIDCLGKPPEDNAQNSGGEEDEMKNAINGICSTVHGMRGAAAHIKYILGDVCTDLFPKVCSAVSKFFSNEITSCYFEKDDVRTRRCHFF